MSDKIEISNWEASEIISLFLAMECLLDSHFRRGSSPDMNNDYLEYKREKIEKSLKIRTKKLLNKMTTNFNIAAQQQQQQSSKEDSPSVA